MEDISHLVNRYRECVRVLWNSFLREDADNQTIDTYAQIKFLLFDEIVLAAIEKTGYVRASAEDTYPFLRVMPRGAGVPVMVNPSTEPGVWTWDDPVNRIDTVDVDLRLIEFFDFGQMGYLDLLYYRTRVQIWPTNPSLVGREALLEVQYATIVFEDLQ